MPATIAIARTTPPSTPAITRRALSGIFSSSFFGVAVDVVDAVVEEGVAVVVVGVADGDGDGAGEDEGAGGDDDAVRGTEEDDGNGSADGEGAGRGDVAVDVIDVTVVVASTARALKVIASVQTRRRRKLPVCIFPFLCGLSVL